MSTKVANAAKRVNSDVEFMRSSPEVSVFMACYGLVVALQELELSVTANHGEISVSQLRTRDKIFCQLCSVVDSTSRFDIVLPVTRCGQFSPFFWKWYNWWSDYLSSLPKSDLAGLEILSKKRSSLANAYRPNGDWLTYRKDPVVLSI